MIQLTQQENLNQRIRLLLMRPQTRREHLRIIEYEQVILIEILHQVGDLLMLYLARLAMQHQHACLVAIRSRKLSNQFFRQFELKLAEFHIIGFVHSRY